MTSQPNAAHTLRSTLFILSGPSGVGKDTVVQCAKPYLRNIRNSISVTTRAPRVGETHGVDYFFVTADEFAEMLEKGDLLEHAVVHGHFYGTPRSWVVEQLAAGTDVLLEIDIQGALQVKAQFPEAILIFLAPPSWPELSRRLRQRQTEDEASIRRRLANARRELARINQYDYLIVNDVLEDAAARLQAIILAERSRPWRQQLDVLLAEGNDDVCSENVLP